MRNRWWATPVLAGAAVLIAACGSSSPSSNGAAAGTSTNSSAPATTGSSNTVATRSTGIGTVLVNSQGRTLYWFAIDTPTKSNCNGTCATFWPPVFGKVTAASGTTLPKGFGTIKRSDGKLQATYDGHPLYTYAADTSAEHDERQRAEPVRRPLVGDDAIGRQAGRSCFGQLPE